MKWIPIPTVDNDPNNGRNLPSIYSFEPRFEHGGLCQINNDDPKKTKKHYMDALAAAIERFKTILQQCDVQGKLQYFNASYLKDELDIYFNYDRVYKLFEAEAPLLDAKVLKLFTISFCLTLQHFKHLQHLHLQRQQHFFNLFLQLYLRIKYKNIGFSIIKINFGKITFSIQYPKNCRKHVFKLISTIFAGLQMLL